MEELVSLLLPLDALLSHEDFNPQIMPKTILTTKYRNMWFICVMFGLTHPGSRPSCMTEWHVQALLRIAEKTPPIVLEDAHDFITSELEFNPILRQDYLHGVRTTNSFYYTLTILPGCHTTSRYSEQLYSTQI